MNVIKGILILLALTGTIVMGYLLNLHFTPEGSSFCNLGEGLSCDIVNKSEYAKVAGVPLSLLGLFYFLLVLYLLVFKYKRKTLGTIVFVTTVFLGPSLYLSAIEFFIINNICVLCEGSKIIMALIVIVAILGMRPVSFNTKKIVTAIALALFLAGSTYIIQANQGVPSGTYDTFAQCIAEKNFIMYGSQGCSFCAKQRALFGDSFKFITEIECDVRFPDFNPEPERCIAKEIKHTPTWIVEDEMGATVKKYEPGVISLEDLAKDSSCELVKDIPADNQEVQ